MVLSLEIEEKGGMSFNGGVESITSNKKLGE